VVCGCYLKGYHEGSIPGEPKLRNANYILCFRSPGPILLNWIWLKFNPSGGSSLAKGRQLPDRDSRVPSSPMSDSSNTIQSMIFGLLSGKFTPSVLNQFLLSSYLISVVDKQ
jgi:hypothetical protein